MYSGARKSCTKAINEIFNADYLRDVQPGKYWHGILGNKAQNRPTGTQLGPGELRHRMPGLSEGSGSFDRATWALPNDTFVLTDCDGCQMQTLSTG